MSPTRPVRVLYSFPHKLGAARICTTAWHQVEGAALAGAEVLVYTGSICRPLPPNVQVHTTLAWGKLRLPSRLLGTYRNSAIHDWLVAKALPRLAAQIDVIHLWPLGAMRTMEVARKLGIPTLLERPNAHTRYAYEIVRQECQTLGVAMPPGHEHAYNAVILDHEEKEYELADQLLCPSEFVAQTFLDRGFKSRQLARHQYGFDHTKYRPSPNGRHDSSGLTVLFAGGCAPRKGLHYALDAWLRSSAHEHGTFLIAGGFIPSYAERLAEKLHHPSIKVLGHRSDLPQLMSQSDILILPSIEEGSALVTSEGRGSGCVLMVSEAAGAICQHGITGLLHKVGDVDTIIQQLNTLNADRELLARIRAASLSSVDELTWETAGRKLCDVYQAAAGKVI
jgi:glycosyltransferase involved in cell wall biosynthesis